MKMLETSVKMTKGIFLIIMTEPVEELRQPEVVIPVTGVLESPQTLKISAKTFAFITN
jgi:hypothetical protein